MIGDILQPTHLLFILVVALLVLGPKRLPEVGRALGRGIRDFRQAISGDELRESLLSSTSEAPSIEEPAVGASASPAATPFAPETTPSAAPTEPLTPAAVATEPPTPPAASGEPPTPRVAPGEPPTPAGTHSRGSADSVPPQPQPTSVAGKRTERQVG